MSVQAFLPTRQRIEEISFNTSYVSVQVEECIAYVEGVYGFQYILCVGSRILYILLLTISKVSIHPMCRFKYYMGEQVLLNKRFQYILCVGSSLELYTKGKLSDKFQYILCVGSSRR